MKGNGGEATQRCPQRRLIETTAAIAIAQFDLFIPVLHCLCFL
jgi:hypothetical protein